MKEIDLLKIDIARTEMAVLKGFQTFIAMSKVKAIQFEINEMNVMSPVFFKKLQRQIFLSGSACARNFHIVIDNR